MSFEVLQIKGWAEAQDGRSIVICLASMRFMWENQRKQS